MSTFSGNNSEDSILLGPPKPQVRRFRRPLWVVLGVVLPLITLAVERIAHLCAELRFDPIPTWGHIALVFMVPVGNGLVLRALRKGALRRRALLLWSNGFVLGVSGFYTLLFAPLLPLSLIAVLFCGLGIFGLAPALALIAALRLRSYVKRMPALQPDRAWRPTLGGILMAAVLLVGLEMSGTITRMGMQMAVSEDAGERARGLRWLRAWGDEELILRACYRPLSYERDLVAYATGALRDVHVSTGNARTIYYRVTGRPFNHVPPPASLDNQRRAWDDAQGGQEVGGQIRGLSLVSSRIDGSLAADAALGYMEWTMTFRNTSKRTREARAQIRLPPGAVVSRASLWIDGEPREAAFGERSQVRTAYERVVRHQRDPLLVTTAGPDRVLVQCFPVPVGSEMKIRIGITAPLLVSTRHQAGLRLPHVEERNFALGHALRHQVWMEADSRLASLGASLQAEQRDSGFALRGGVADKALTDGWLQVQRSPQARLAWTQVPGQPDQVIVQTLAATTATAPTRIALVVDGSASVAEALHQVAEVVPALAAKVPLLVLFAADSEVVEIYRDNGPSADVQAAVRRLSNMSAVGGRDNIPALVVAWEWAGAEPGGALIWIHGPQPVALGDAAALWQRLERSRQGPALYELSVAPGRNLLLEGIEARTPVQAMPRWSAWGQIVDAELLRVFGHPEAGLRAVRTRRDRGQAQASQYPEREGEQSSATPIQPYDQPLGQLLGPASAQTSAHLARLWAADEVARLRAAGERAAAVALAVQYQLVTPVSGAVVLENQTQYDEAGLEPVASGTVPTIPEPETWLLLAVAALILGSLLMYQRRRGHYIGGVTQ